MATRTKPTTKRMTRMEIKMPFQSRDFVGSVTSSLKRGELNKWAKLNKRNFEKNVIFHLIGNPGNTFCWSFHTTDSFWEQWTIFTAFARDYFQIPTELMGSIDNSNLLVRVPRKDLFRHSKGQNSPPPHQRASCFPHFTRLSLIVV